MREEVSRMSSSDGIPLLARQFLAELLGTFLLVFLGESAIAQCLLLTGQVQMLNVALAFGLALSLGIFVSGAVSGGHLNPAVTLALCVDQKCTWRQLPVYWLAQYLGAFLGALLVHGSSAEMFSIAQASWNNSTSGGLDQAAVFASFPSSPDLSYGSLILDQLVGPALLLIVILAVTDRKNMAAPSGSIPILIGLGLTLIILSQGFTSGAAVNPARDFAPRLVALIFGLNQSGGNAFQRASYFFWIPWIVPHLGALLGALLYMGMISLHHPHGAQIV